MEMDERDGDGIEHDPGWEAEIGEKGVDKSDLLRWIDSLRETSPLPDLQLLETGVCLRAAAKWSGDPAQGYPLLVQDFELAFIHVGMDESFPGAEITWMTKKSSMNFVGRPVGNEVGSLLLDDDTAVRAFMLSLNQRLNLPSEPPNTHGPISVVSVSDQHPGVFLIDTMERPTGVSMWVIKTLSEALVELREQLIDAEETEDLRTRDAIIILQKEISLFVDLHLELWTRRNPPEFGKQE